MSVLLATWWNRMGWEQIDTWKRPQTTSNCCKRQLPYFCGHVPQESGTRAGGSLSENWPKRLRHADKNSHWIQLRLLILYLWKLWVNLVHKKFDGWDYQNFFEWKVLKFWTSAADLSWVHTATCRTDYCRLLSRVTKVSKPILSPSVFNQVDQ